MRNSLVFGHLASDDRKVTQGCPCGFFTDPQKECTCTPLQIQRYRSKVSGPLLDRIDIQVEVPTLRYQELASKDAGEPSAAIRQRVNGARVIAVQAPLTARSDQPISHQHQ